MTQPCYELEVEHEDLRAIFCNPVNLSLFSLRKQNEMV